MDGRGKGKGCRNNNAGWCLWMQINRVMLSDTALSIQNSAFGVLFECINDFSFSRCLPANFDFFLLLFYVFRAE